MHGRGGGLSRTVRLMLLACLLLAIAPAAASAATYCVQDPACVANGGTDRTTLTLALNAADGTPERDTIRIGPVPLTENAVVAVDNDVDIIGAGTGSTQIIGGPGLDLREPSSSVSRLRFTVPSPSSANAALYLKASASDIAVDAAAGATSPIGVLAYRGARLTNATVDLPNVTSGGGTGVTLVNIGSGLPPPVVEDSSITAFFGVTGTHGTLTRVSTAATYGIYIQGYGGTVTVDESLIRIDPAGTSGFGLVTQTNLLSGFPTSATINARGVTIAGDGTGTIGVASNSSNVNGTSAHINLRNSIINNVEKSITRYAETNTTSNVNVDWSNYDPATVQETGPGTLTQGPNNLDVDPMFADAAAFNFRLRPESPLVERGDPAGLAAGESATDRDGASRVFDANGDCAARRDIGAYEFHPGQRAPVGSAGANPESAPVGAPFTFSASACDPDGDAVTYNWSFDDGATATGPDVQHAFATPGTHSATVTIGGGSGPATTITRTVTVTPGAVPADLTAPVISDASLLRKAFRVARASTALSARAKAGTAFRYTVSEPGSVSFKIQRKTAGRISGRRCVKSKPSLRRNRRCKLYVSAGKTLTRRVTTGGQLQSTAFSGRIGKKALRPGSYRVSLTATDLAGNVSKPRVLAFKIVRR